MKISGYWQNKNGTVFSEINVISDGGKVLYIFTTAETRKNV
jgi:hypothetical protein